MRLSVRQLERFEEDGVLVLPGLFSPEEVNLLRAQLPALFAERCPENFREKDSDLVRTAMALHLRNEMFARLVRHPRLLEPALQILREDVYIQRGHGDMLIDEPCTRQSPMMSIVPGGPLADTSPPSSTRVVTVSLSTVHSG